MVNTCNMPIAIGFYEVKRLRGRHRYKACRLARLQKSVDYHVQVNICQPVYVVRQEDFLMPYVLADRQEALADE